MTEQDLIYSPVVLQVNITSSKRWIKLREVLKAEVISISLLLPLSFYFKNNKNN